MCHICMNIDATIWWFVRCDVFSCCKLNGQCFLCCSVFQTRGAFRKGEMSGFAGTVPRLSRAERGAGSGAGGSAAAGDRVAGDAPGGVVLGALPVTVLYKTA